MAYGFSARTVSRFVVLTSLCWSAVGLAASPDDVPQADQESSLLHRKIDLSNCQRWDRTDRRWVPYSLRPAKVYVVNLWSPICKPCRDEFPQFRSMANGWRSHPEVQFVFLSDPPDLATKADVAKYWQEHQAELPDGDPVRTDTSVVRDTLGTARNPITLIVDENLIVRQAFVGAIGDRPLVRSIERYLQTAMPTFALSGKSKRTTKQR